jgi:hypothetical protein
MNNNHRTMCTNGCDPAYGEGSNMMAFRLETCCGTGARNPGPWAEMGGAAVFLSDRDSPVLDYRGDTSGGDQTPDDNPWLNSGNFSVSPLAHDDGLGMRSFTLRIPGRADDVRNLLCTTRCQRHFGWPNNWQGHGAFFYNVSGSNPIPEGINKIQLWGHDALDKPVYDYWYVKKDTLPPTLELGDFLSKSGNQTVETDLVSDTFELDVNAFDGQGSTNSPGQGSGVRNIKIEVYNHQTGETTPITRTNPDNCSGRHSCGQFESWKFDPKVWGLGTFDFRVVAYDHLNQQSAVSTIRTTFVRQDRYNTTIQSPHAFGDTSNPSAAAGKIQAARDVGAGGVRVFAQWDAATRSSAFASANSSCTAPSDPQVVSTASNYSLDSVVQQVNEAHARGMAVTVTFDSPIPCWAQSADTPANERCASGSRCVYSPDLDLYGEFVKAVVARVGTKVNRWSAWNEPNIASHLAPQRVGTDVYTGARLYRSLHFKAEAVIRAGGSQAPLIFGDVALSPENAVNPEQTTWASDFLRWAGCHNVPNCPHASEDIESIELGFHSYIGANIERFKTYENDFDPNNAQPRIYSDTGDPVRVPQHHADEVAEIERARAFMQGTPIAPNMQWLAETEFGVHYGEREQPNMPQDPGGDAWFPIGGGASARAKQAAYLNCSEQAVWTRSNTVRFAQYPFEDGGPTSWNPSGDWQFQTGLRFASGADKPALEAFRVPFTVTGSPAAGIRVWGGWRPSSRPAALYIVGYNASGQQVWSDGVSLVGSKYFKTVFWNVPSTVVKYRLSGPGFMSRMATPGDCGPEWLGGSPKTP